MEFKLAEIQTFVSDLADAQAFYEGLLGLRLKKRSDRRAIYDLGATSLVVSVGAARGEAPDQYGKRPSTAPVFLCHDIRATYARLRSCGVRVVQDLQEFTEGMLAVIADPDGNLIELIG